MTHTQDVHIARSSRGWSVHTIQQWTDFPTSETHGPATSLAWAIFTTACWAGNNDTAITSLTVHGRPYPRAKVVTAIRRHASGRLGYELKHCMAAIATLA